ncbi:PCRF domain-containing protein [Microcoleus sp. OTE_8_concoct_300]|uniref:PCRF domain-containing protein n=1 Tax=Microcoleus sp. OTE_8_concoct_300 TaxID=2964710 RepID=UPI00403F109A
MFSSALTAESQKLQQLAAQPKSGNSINNVEPILQELDALQSYQAKLNQCQTCLADIQAAAELLEFQADEELEQELQTNLAQLNCSLEECELEQSLSGPCDKNGAYLIISAAIDDLDALDWAQMLLRMYGRWGQNRGYRVILVEDSLLEYVEINSAILEIGGVNSLTLAIDGRYAYGYLKSETGVHLLKRTSPFNITRKQASSVTVEVVPMYVELEIPQQDLELIILPPPYVRCVIRTLVRIVHVPTGISAISGEERSRLLNRETALALLKSKLFAIMQRQGVQQLADIQGEILKTVLNQPIREYQLVSDSANQGKVLDLGTGIQTTAVAEVLDGKIDSFIKAGVLLKN